MALFFTFSLLLPCGPARYTLDARPPDGVRYRQTSPAMPAGVECDLYFFGAVLPRPLENRRCRRPGHHADGPAWPVAGLAAAAGGRSGLCPERAAHHLGRCFQHLAVQPAVRALRGPA